MAKWEGDACPDCLGDGHRVYMVGQGKKAEQTCPDCGHVQPYHGRDDLLSMNARQRRLLERFRDYAAQKIHQAGAHHDPIWAEVADAIER